MQKLLISIISLVILFGQDPPKNQFSLGLHHQFTAYSISYEGFFYKYNSLECGIGFGGSSLLYEKELSNNLRIPLNYKIYLTRIKFLELRINPYVCLESKTNKYHKFGN
jgi:hypothetical protein